jgi:hypothetical protein
MRVASITASCFVFAMAARAATLDVCRLIPTSAFQSVEGAPAVDTKGSERVTGGLRIAQCFYTLSTSSRSVSLEVTLPGPDPATRSHPKDYWRRLFHDRDRQDREARESESGLVEVPGLGAPAFWEGTGPVGALYAFHKDSIVRVSIGGAAEHDVSVEKTKTLLRAALSSLDRLGKEER